MEYRRSIVMQKQFIAETLWILNCDWSTVIFEWWNFATEQSERKSRDTNSFILPFGYRAAKVTATEVIACEFGYNLKRL